MSAIPVVVTVCLVCDAILSGLCIYGIIAWFDFRSHALWGIYYYYERHDLPRPRREVVNQLLSRYLRPFQQTTQKYNLPLFLLEQLSYPNFYAENCISFGALLILALIVQLGIALIFFAPGMLYDGGVLLVSSGGSAFIWVCSTLTSPTAFIDGVDTRSQRAGLRGGHSLINSGDHKF